MGVKTVCTKELSRHTANEGTDRVTLCLNHSLGHAQWAANHIQKQNYLIEGNIFLAVEYILSNGLSGQRKALSCQSFPPHHCCQDPDHNFDAL